ncbi:uncharacterized protein [Engystomops pustulosus]|uniref:uncharacterized protein n=1 Tax=Engystomops pustulosus TaxID=76066 RepID=UPI003AFA59BA
MSLSMVGRFSKREKFSGFLHGIFLLLSLSANCYGDINQTKALICEMQRQARELFNKSIIEHNISMEDCKRPFPDWSVWPLDNTLDRINEKLHYFINAFDLLFLRHTEEDKHTEMLKAAKVNMEALLISLLEWSHKSLDNLLNAHMRKVLRTKLELPNKENIYDQKLECCQLVNAYMDFLEVVHKLSQKISTRRSKRHFFTNRKKTSFTP